MGGEREEDTRDEDFNFSSSLFLSPLYWFFLTRSRCSTFTLQQEVPPEGNDRRLSAQRLLLLGEVGGKELTERLSCETTSCLAENPAED